MKPDQLSQTAAFIAIKFYGLTRMEPYRSWFDDEIIRFYDQLVQTLPSPLNRYHSILQNKWIRKFFIWSEELLLPGDLMHIIARKYFIGRKVQKLLADDYDQLLVLGAGFDHLAAWHSSRGIPCIEIDAPHMAGLKRDFLQDSQWDNPDLAIVENHFSTTGRFDLEQVELLNPDVKTVIVAEGFFDYLDPGQCRKILEYLSSFFKNSPLVISTIFALDELSFFRRAVFKTGVWMVGEKIRLDLSLTGFREMLDEAGFSEQVNPMDSREMRQQLLVPNSIKRAILDGFYLNFSQR